MTTRSPIREWMSSRRDAFVEGQPSPEERVQNLERQVWNVLTRDVGDIMNNMRVLREQLTTHQEYHAMQERKGDSREAGAQDSCHALAMILPC